MTPSLGGLWLVGTAAYNPHVQNMVRALADAGALRAYMTTGVDVYRRTAVRSIRRGLGALLPAVDREMNRRAVGHIPSGLVRSRWRWELPRVLGSRLGLDERVVDWLWERGEFDLDRACARMVGEDGVDAYLGIEFGALASIAAARSAGKPAVLAFMSPHHRTLTRCLEGEYETVPETAPDSRQYFQSRMELRRTRLDQEAALADWVVANSSFTARSLVDGGVRADKILTVPLGGPVPIRPDALPATKPPVLRIVYVGALSVRKGAHHLLRAWRHVARPGIELHFYGTMLLPERLRREAESARGGSTITFHGSVPATELPAVYRNSSVLVLPTLCDGFGMVVTEALAHGLPVVTTRNAGAADALDNGRTGLVINAADPDALVAALVWCRDHPDELFAMRGEALSAAGRWTWTDYRRRFIDALGRAIGSEPPSAVHSAHAALGAAG